MVVDANRLLRMHRLGGRPFGPLEETTLGVTDA
jgi:hypothetical protein